jgi:hypothetical protein
MHKLLYAQEFLAQAAGRMQSGEIIMTKIAALQQGNSQRIANRHGHRGARGRREI